MILAGDIGGTNARLALFEIDEKTGPHQPMPLKRLVSQVYPSRSANQFEDIIAEFLTSHPAEVQGSCLGIAGPVRLNRCHATNLPWTVDAQSLAKRFQIGQVTLLNDLVANACGIDALGQADLLTVDSGQQNATGNRAIISPGTGLGEAGLFWDGQAYQPFATEGGHCDFGPTNPQQMQLAQFLQDRLGHVSYEALLSGNGLENIYRFTRQQSSEQEPEWFTQRCQQLGTAAAISQTAIQKEFSPCETALTLFLTILGQEAGNLALKTMATGGLYLGGGISAKLANAIQQSDDFLQGFRNKDKMAHLMEDIPIHIILNQDTALMGAALAGSKSLR